MCTKHNFDKRRHASFKTQLSLRSFSALIYVVPARCQYREFAVALLGPVYFLLPDQQSEIHCNICAIQLLTPNSLGGT